MKFEKILDGLCYITTGINISNAGAVSNNEHAAALGHQPEDDPGKQLLLDKSATFFMWVNSDSMKGAGIYSGDMVIIDRSLKAASGKIVIALLNGEMLIRRFEKTFNKIRLVPETDKLAPIDIDGSCEEFSVCGVVTHVIRPV